MNTAEFSGIIFLSSVLAGLLGSLTGLGGGFVVVPVLTLLFHVNLRYAIGASLIAVIATSSGAAAAYVREGYSNIRIGMFLEIATTLGALLGAYLTARISTHAIGLIFGIVLFYSAYSSVRKKQEHAETMQASPLAARLRLCGTLPGARDGGKYAAHRVPAGFGLMFGAGAISGLLGIGSGTVKVLAMDQAMGLPFKVSTTTSNFMIGVTAAASVGIYLSRGYISPGLAMPVMLGVLAGSLLGTKLLVRAEVNTLRIVFALVIVVSAVEMIVNSIAGRL